MSNYDAVIFDQDGVLLDSGLNNFFWMDRVRKNAAKNKGYNFTTQDSLKIVKSRSKEEAEKFIDEKGMTWTELREIERSVSIKKVEMIKQGYIRLFRDSHRLLNKLNIPAGMATNATNLSTDFVMKFFGIESYFDSVRTVELEPGRWFECKKPNSTLVDGVRSDLDADNVLMVGDTFSDVGAATAAGIDSVLIESYGEKPDLNPTYRVKNLYEVAKLL